MSKMRFLPFLGSMASAAISMIALVVIATIDFSFATLRSMFSPDIRTEQSLTEILNSLMSSFDKQWQRAKSFLSEALTHDKFGAGQFKDCRSPTLQC